MPGVWSGTIAQNKLYFTTVIIFTLGKQTENDQKNHFFFFIQQYLSSQSKLQVLLVVFFVLFCLFETTVYNSYCNHITSAS